MFSAQQLDALLGTFVPYRLHMRLVGPVETYRYAHEGATPEEREAQATITHEQFHFFQTILTGYGQIAWLIQRQATALITDEWQRLTAASSKKRIPLAHLAQSDQHAVSPVQKIERVLDEFYATANGRFSTSKPEGRLRDLGAASLDFPWHLNPRITANGATHFLQGKEVIEGHALFTESAYLNYTEGTPVEAGFDPKAVSKTYTAAWEWFNETCPNHISHFPLICDLALQTSWRPTIPTTEQEWRAAHPAWRFVALTRALKSMKMRQLPPGEIARWYGDYAARLLERCGYLALNEVLSERLRAFERPSATALDRMMKSAMEYRLEKPWCLANPVVDVPLWNELSRAFPIPVIETEGELGSPHRDRELIFEIMNEFQYQALALQIAGDTAPDARLECGFAKFGITKGCSYQRSHGCTGRFVPQHGLPHPVLRDELNYLGGCHLGILLDTMDIDVASIDIEPSARTPAEPRK